MPALFIGTTLRTAWIVAGIAGAGVAGHGVVQTVLTWAAG